MRRLGHGGRGVGTLTPGTTGRTRLDGIAAENAIETVPLGFGSVWLNDQIGCVPFGAAIVTRMRDPARSIVLVTHYQRLLTYVVPDVVHVLLEGRILRTGDAGLALELENRGYDWVRQEARVA